MRSYFIDFPNYNQKSLQWKYIIFAWGSHQNKTAKSFGVVDQSLASSPIQHHSVAFASASSKCERGKESWKMVKCLFQRKLLHVSVPTKGWICHTTTKGWFLPGKAIDLCSHMLYLNWSCLKRDGPTFQILWTNSSKLLRVIFFHMSQVTCPRSKLCQDPILWDSHPTLSSASHCWSDKTACA